MPSDSPRRFDKKPKKVRATKSQGNSSLIRKKSHKRVPKLAQGSETGKEMSFQQEDEDLLNLIKKQKHPDHSSEEAPEVQLSPQESSDFVSTGQFPQPKLFGSKRRPRSAQSTGNKANNKHNILIDSSSDSFHSQSGQKQKSAAQLKVAPSINDINLQGLKCNLVEPLTILSHDRVKLNPTKKVMTMSNYVFICSNNTKIPAKFDDRVIRMKNAKRLLHYSLVPAQDHQPIGRVSQKVYAEKDVVYIEQKIGINLEDSNKNAYDFRDCREFETPLLASITKSKSKTKVPDVPMNVQTMVQFYKHPDFVFGAREKTVFSFGDYNAAAEKKDLDPYIQALNFPDDVSPPFYYDEHISVSKNQIEIVRSTRLAKAVASLTTLLNSPQSSILQEDRIYAQCHDDIDKHLKAIQFKPVLSPKRKETKRQLKTTRSIPSIEINSSKNTVAKPVGTPSVAVKKSPAREVKAKSPNPPKTEKTAGFPIFDILADMADSVTTENTDLTKSSEKAESVENCEEKYVDQWKKEIGIREKGSQHSKDDTLDEVASLKEEYGSSTCVSGSKSVSKGQRKMPEKAKKLKKVIQPKQCYTLKERRMIENGGVDSQKQLYFKGLSQAVALPSGAAPEVEKKLEPEVQLSSEVEVSKSSEVDEKTSKKIKRSRTRSQYSNLSRFSSKSITSPHLEPCSRDTYSFIGKSAKSSKNSQKSHSKASEASAEKKDGVFVIGKMNGLPIGLTVEAKNVCYLKQLQAASDPSAPDITHRAKKSRSQAKKH